MANKRIQKKIEKRNRSIDNRSQSLRDARNKDNLGDAKRLLALAINELSETIKEVKEEASAKNEEDIERLKNEIEQLKDEIE